MTYTVNGCEYHRLVEALRAAAPEDMAALDPAHADVVCQGFQYRFPVPIKVPDDYCRGNTNLGRYLADGAPA